VCPLGNTNNIAQATYFGYFVKAISSSVLKSKKKSQLVPFMAVEYAATEMGFLHWLEYAFEGLNSPSFCLNNFGAVTLHGLGKSNGIVVDFGLLFDPELNKKYCSSTLEDEDLSSYVSSKIGQFNRGDTHQLGTLPHICIQCVYQNKAYFPAIFAKRDETTTLENFVQRIMECVSKLPNTKQQQEVLQNIVFVGEEILFPPKDVETLLCKTLSVKNINVYTPQNKITAVWEGTSLYAATTYNNPSYQSTDIDYYRDKSYRNKYPEADELYDNFPLRSEGSGLAGKWLLIEPYVKQAKISYYEQGIESYCPQIFPAQFDSLPKESPPPSKNRCPTQ